MPEIPENGPDIRKGPLYHGLFRAAGTLFANHVAQCEAALGRQASERVDLLWFNKHREPVAMQFRGAESVRVSSVELPNKYSPFLRIRLGLQRAGQPHILSEYYKPEEDADSEHNARFTEELQRINPDHTLDELLGSDKIETYVVHASPEGDPFIVNDLLLSRQNDPAQRLAHIVHLQQMKLTLALEHRDVLAVLALVQDATPDLDDFRNEFCHDMP
jgi:hypothetical protein